MIQLQGIRLRRGSRIILDDATLNLHPGEKVGLVGRNGAGKSSLFALLTGRLHEDQGDWSMPKSWRISEVLQHLDDEPVSATDFVMQGDRELVRAQAELSQAQQAGDGMAIAHAHAALTEAGALDARARAQALIAGLGFERASWEQPVTTFSGGWRMRLQLARALMCPCEVLLLDEPTNHLDMDALVWLEDWLKRFSGLAIIISHDKRFLDAVTQATVHLRLGQLTRYGGNHSQFEALLAVQLEQQQIAHERQQAHLARLQGFVDRFKAKATKAKQAQSRVKAMERMTRIAPVLAEADFVFQFETPEALPNPMFSLRGAQLGYSAPDQAPTPVLHGVQLEVFAGQRIGVLGANGQGKSTLVKSLQGTLPLLAGQLQWGKGLRIGYFAQQEMDLLDGNDTPLSHGLRLTGANSQTPNEQVWRDFIGGFGFGAELAQQTIASLSGGEKARLLLASLVFMRPNLLVLDEPTNHLDMATREALALALNDFEGSVLLVSHDRELLDAACDSYYWVQQGQVQAFEGQLADYERLLLQQARQRSANTVASNPQASVTSAPSALSPKEQRQLQAQARAALQAKTQPLKKQCLALEQQLQTWEAQKNALLERMAQSPDGGDWATWGQDLKQLETRIEAAEAQWLTLQDQLQALEDAAQPAGG